MIPDQVMQYLPFIIPLIIVQLALLITALIHIFKHDKYRVGNRVIWIVICVAINLIGPVLYLIIGRSDE